MICKKCGHDAGEGTSYCPYCGKTLSGKSKAGKFFKTLLFAVIILTVIVGSFAVGLRTGSMNSPKSTDTSQSDTIGLLDAVAKKIQEIAVIPVTLEYTQTELNSMIQSNAALFSPLSDLKLSFPSEGGIGFSATAKKDDIKKVLGSSFPEFLLVFLSDTVPIYINLTPSVTDGELAVNVNTVTISGVSVSGDVINNLGANTIIASTLSDIIKSKFGESVELTDISVTQSASSGEPVLKIKANYYLTK